MLLVGTRVIDGITVEAYQTGATEMTVVIGDTRIILQGMGDNAHVEHAWRIAEEEIKKENV